jgi:hypothetical protein
MLSPSLGDEVDDAILHSPRHATGFLPDELITAPEIAREGRQNREQDLGLLAFGLVPLL